MKFPPLLFIVIVAVACKHKQQPEAPALTTDSIETFGTVTGRYSGADRIQDSLERKRLVDSFYSIKPLAVFRSDEKNDAFNIMIASFMNTVDVINTPIAFSDTVIYKYNRKKERIAERRISRSKRFVVEVFRWYERSDPDSILINGRELRPGIEVDTSLSGSLYKDLIGIYSDGCSLMKFGTKEYLFISGNIDRCNGMGCGVSYYLLYDVANRKGMLLEQFRSDFIAGYDKKSNSPVFFNMASNAEYLYGFQCFYFSGKGYRLNNANQIEPLPGKDGRQVEFTAYSRDGVDSLILTSATFPY